MPCCNIRRCEVLFGRKSKSRMTQVDALILIKNSLEAQKLEYKVDEKTRAFYTKFQGDDLPIAVSIVTDEISICFVMHLDLCATPDNYNNVAWSLNCINKKLCFGSFKLDPEDGTITFEYGLPFVESNYSIEFFVSLTKLLVNTVDEFDGELKKIAEKKPYGHDSMYG